MSGTLAAIRVVREDVDDRDFHQRAQPDCRPAVVADDQRSNCDFRRSRSELAKEQAMLFLHELYMHRDQPAHRMRSRSMIVNPLLTPGSWRIYEITGRQTTSIGCFWRVREHALL
jgi:hypothetical protein